MDLILASTSPYRRAQLGRLGLPFRAIAPLVDEESIKDPALDPRTLAETLAIAKASSLADRWPEAAIVGGDQLVVIDGQILGKPGTAEAAVEQLSRLAGRSHDLITALAVWAGGRRIVHLDVTVLHMRRLEPVSIERYVAADRPIDCAGSYKWEERGVALFERVESADPTAIPGLPLIALTSILRDLGFTIP